MKQVITIKGIDAVEVTYDPEIAINKAEIRILLQPGEYERKPISFSVDLSKELLIAIIEAWFLEEERQSDEKGTTGVDR